MTKIHTIDLQFLKTNEAIASFLVETSEGPILIETGPASTSDQLESGIRKLGFAMTDIKHVLLTHIHFDHAGAAWKFASLGAKIYVHPVGVPHLENPSKLWNSAAQIYGDQMEYLWGNMESIPLNQLVSVAHQSVLKFGDLAIKAIHTPGHASHHIAWKLDDCIFTGDVAGVKIADGPAVPPCPPPDINLDDWKRSIQLIKDENPEHLYLTHFGKISNVKDHLDYLEKMLDSWSNWIKPHFEKNTDQKEVIPIFMEFTQQQLRDEGCNKELIQVYEYANPSWMSVAGLYRYWKLKSLGKI
ncbi:MBL fold metallo-hydrolase [Mongoliibacter ruber]|uniref:Glyoxylase-like metal-dependent hydrolase (Beta-lactamase superfamily II) n=1 Tax=Mongoliibacter ruber TaxID=1750599 RepID=A0A2T0WP93_9BACT|nr:MBL fold metallo-hydrolase [Mongoliibacter ruber]PRY88510.1 glyoxylase-like metal-dependent hydrolase (beta-lactamase superfamily II) [Mongoliibacter ruber]